MRRSRLPDRHGRIQLHPLIAIYDLQWSVEDDLVKIETISREKVKTMVFQNTPFSDLLDRKKESVKVNLANASEREAYPLLDQLYAEGLRDYAAWSHPFDDDVKLKVADLTSATGAAFSVATRRVSGFSDADIKGLERLLKPIFLCVRLASERALARALLETYLGRATGGRVLTGQSARGDGETIDCVIFYSDMRDSSVLSQSLPLPDYLKALNRYFDCVAGAVTDHGGEVLKFIGDGVLAMFPIVDGRRPAPAMCAAALSAAREAQARARQHEHGPVFGTALHVGQVVYGNVGTPDRLDYTATGAAVALAARCEALTRSLGTQIVATADFIGHCAAGARDLGQHPLRGFPEPVALWGFGPEA